MNNTLGTKVSKSEDPINEKHDKEGEHAEVDPEHHDGLDKKKEIFENSSKINSLEEFLNSKTFINYCLKVSAYCLRVYGHKQQKYHEPEDIIADAYQNLVAWLPKFRGEALPTTVINRVIRNLYADALRQEMSKKRWHLEVNFEGGNLESLMAGGSFVEDFEVNEANGNFTSFWNSLPERDQKIAKICLECRADNGKVVKAKIKRIVSENGIEEDFSSYDFRNWKESMKRKLESWRRNKK